MEVRCGKCSKLFRVADEKITGKGVKFACTRCHEQVQITREDFENYRLSQTAVSALDLFTEKPKEEAPAPAATDLSAALAVPSEPSAPEEPAATSGEDLFKEREEAAPSGPASVDASSPLAEPFAAPAEPQAEAPAFSLAEEQAPAVAEPEREAPLFEEPVAFGKPLPTAGAEAGAAEETAPAAPQPETPPAPLPAAAAPKPEPAPQSAPAAPKPQPEPRPEVRPAEPRQPVPPRTEPARALAASAAPVARKEGPRPTSAVIGAAPKAQPRSAFNLYLIVAAVVAVVAIAVGAYLFLGSSSTEPEGRAPVAPRPASAPTALVISNTAGAMQANGDLLITGTVENTTDRPQSTWFVVVDVYDSAGAVLQKLRLLNGKQVHTRSDYEVLARRGIPVQDLKARATEGYVTVVPPKGKVPFEVRYIQPPAGVASFNAALQPVDTAQLMKEIAEEAK